MPNSREAPRSNPGCWGEIRLSRCQPLPPLAPGPRVALGGGAWGQVAVRGSGHHRTLGTRLAGVWVLTAYRCRQPAPGAEGRVLGRRLPEGRIHCSVGALLALSRQRAPVLGLELSPSSTLPTGEGSMALLAQGLSRTKNQESPSAVPSEAGPLPTVTVWACHLGLAFPKGAVPSGLDLAPSCSPRCPLPGPRHPGCPSTLPPEASVLLAAASRGCWTIRGLSRPNFLKRHIKYLPDHLLLPKEDNGVMSTAPGGDGQPTGRD